MHETPSPLPETGHDDPHAAVAKDLNALVDQIECFLQAQVHALEEALQTGEAAQPDSELLRQLGREFQEERERWELERQETLARLRQEGTLLTNAWQRLEEEQRKLLAERERMRRCSAANAQSVTSDRAGTPVSSAPSDAKGSKDALAWAQFQRLRREFCEHGGGAK